MRQVVALIAIAWSLLNIVVAGLFMASSFTAGTPRKEGFVAELALLFGGSLILLFAVILARQAWKLFRHRASA